MAPDYLLVPRDQLDETIGALRDAARRTYPEVAGNEDYAQLVDERRLERIEAMRQEAERAGARLVTLQERGSDRRLPLTLVVDPDETLALMREEVFGPLLPIKAYDAIDEAVDFVNARERPLALYYFGEDDAERSRVLDRTISGTVAINEVVLQVAQEDLPFGGIGASGMGAYHGIEGFRTFSHARAVFTQSRFNVAKIAGLVPPFGKKLQRMIDFSLK
jgi:coniferyl-aldehyde dehydrogenase